MRRPYFPHSPLKIFGFFLAGIFFVISSFVLIYLARGYIFELDGLKLSFRKTGMIIFTSRPNGANVTLDGKKVKQKSGSSLFPSKIAGLSTGDYTLRLEKAGYLTWSKIMHIDEEIVSWADYIVLFPKTPRKDLLVEDGKVLGAEESPDLRRIAYIYENKEKKKELWYFDALNLEKTKLYPIKKEDLASSIDLEISDIKWSADSSKILFRRKTKDKSELISVNTRDIENSVNVSATFNMDFTDLSWSPTDPNQLFWLKEGSVYRMDISNKTLSASLADKTISLNVTDDRSVYLVRETGAERSLWQMDTSGNNLTKIVKSLPESKNYTIKYSTANGHLLIIVDGTVRTLYLAKNIGGNINLTELSKDATDAFWSPNGKKILFINEKNIWTYDMEKEKESEVLKDIDVKSAFWYIDGYHIATNVGDEYKILEFDGGNPTTVGISKAKESFFSLEFKYLFYLGGTGKENDNLVIYSLR